MANIKLICHIDNTQCYAIGLFDDYTTNKDIDKCKDCPKRWENYYKLLDESIKSVESNPDSNIHLIRKDVKRTIENGGFMALDKNLDDEYGYLLCATATNEDYYYVWINKNFHIRYSSACIGYIDLDEFTEVPDFCAELSKTIRENPEKIRKLLEGSLEKNKYDKVITEINI